VMDLTTGSRNRVPVARLIRRTVRELRPHARELGSGASSKGSSRSSDAARRRTPARVHRRTATSSRSRAQIATRPKPFLLVKPASKPRLPVKLRCPRAA
jgi:hypothetical protein